MCGFVFFFALGTLSGFAQVDNSKQISRKELLQETLRLLDKLESDYPMAQVDVVKIRERVMGIFQNPIVVSNSASDPQIAYNRKAVAAKKARAKRKIEEWKEFYESVKSYHDDNLKEKLKAKLSKQRALKYSDARRYVMLQVDNYENYIECIYTGKVIKADKMPSHTIMNIEHSWPQSHGATGIAKSDMHHLYPTDPIANSKRGSLPFGLVSHSSWESGGSKCDGSVFEPRKKYRGNLARGLFYFSVRYSKKIGSNEEAILRSWAKADPIDANEKARNDRVESIQGNRNPFIDHPEFINQINDF